MERFVFAISSSSNTSRISPHSSIPPFFLFPPFLPPCRRETRTGGGRKLDARGAGFKIIKTKRRTGPKTKGEGRGGGGRRLVTKPAIGDDDVRDDGGGGWMDGWMGGKNGAQQPGA